MSHFRNKSSLTQIEFLTMLCIIFVLFGIFAIYANIGLRIVKETALRNELHNIRMSIEHYRVVSGRLPEGLFVLINQNFTLKSPDGTILRRKFLKDFRVDEEGYLLDLFMNRYSYQTKEGRVSSTTKGYESW